eukprot:2451620-Pleurochrysis_carterae.AAC.1
MAMKVGEREPVRTSHRVRACEGGVRAWCAGSPTARLGGVVGGPVARARARVGAVRVVPLRVVAAGGKKGGERTGAS